MNADPRKSGQGLFSRLGIGARLRAYFFAGILVTAPVSITFYIAWKVVSFVDEQISPLIPPALDPKVWAIPGVGLILAVVGLTLIGALTTNFLGGLVVKGSDFILARMPVIKGIYSAIKQVFHTILGNKAEAFREVVLVEYPRSGSWAVGFITSHAGQEILSLIESGNDVVSVFIPSTPNPTSGFLIYVPKSQLRILDMTVEEGLKLSISMGVLSPNTSATR